MLRYSDPFKPNVAISPTARGGLQLSLAGCLLAVALPASAQLTATGDQLWTESDLGGSPFHDSAFGHAMATGDFDGDGRPDLAVSATGADPGAFDSGLVYAIYSGRAGLSASGAQAWHQGSPGVMGASEEADEFGSALATGDFDGDGVSDLAVGVPYEGIGGAEDAGAVNVLYGFAGVGLSSAFDQLFHQDSDEVKGVAEANDFFGFALAAADFNGDGRDDLAIGVPGEALGSLEDAGAVNVIYGTTNGLDPAFFDQLFDLNDVPGAAAQEQSVFGWSLTAGDFNGDGFSDLAVGVPFWDLNPQTIISGATAVFYGGAAGLGSGQTSQLWHQDSGLDGVAETGDLFGETLASGDVNGDQIDDLVIAAPGEGLNDGSEGVVHIVFGNSVGLTGAGDQLLFAPAADLHDQDFGDALAVADFDGDGYDDLAVSDPWDGVDGLADAGSVLVYLGGAGGLSSAIQLWSQNSPGVQGGAEVDDQFGGALTAADFDQDGRADLAIGVSRESFGAWENAGVVHILRGHWPAWQMWL